MSATARAVPHRTGPVRRVGAPRSGASRSGTARTGTHRTGPVRRTDSAPVGRQPSRPVLRLVPTAPAPVPAVPVTPAAGTARRAPFVVLVGMLLVGTVLGLLFLNTAIAVDSLHATALRQENAQKAQEVDRLEQQVVAGRTPAALAAAATAAGLVPAGAAAYLVVEPDGTSTVRGTAEPAAPAAPPPAVPTTGG